MEVMAFLKEDFERLQDMRLTLHNKERHMTFDEQRDFAERLRLVLERAQPLDV
jgi:hypothetical protein